MIKRKFISFLLLFLPALCYLSCQESDSGGDAGSQQSLIQNARNYFNAKVNVPGVSFNAENPRAQRARTVQWDKAFTYELFTNVIAVSVPIKYNDRTTLGTNITDRRVNLSDYTNLIIYQDQRRHYVCEVVTLMPQIGYSGRNGSAFAGLVMVEDWQGNALKAFEHGRDGDTWLLSPSSKDATLTIGRTQDYVVEVCTIVHGWNYSVNDEDGQHWTEVRNCYYYIREEGGTPGGGGGYPGGGGGGPGTGLGSGPDTDDDPGLCPESPCSSSEIDVLNQVEHKCVAGLVNQVVNSNVMGNFLNNRGLFDEDMRWQVYMESYSPSSTMAITSKRRDQIGVLFAATNLNSSGLLNTSQEYIVATIIHEFIHAYRNVYVPGSTEQSDHEYMATEIFDEMIQMLHTIYPGMNDDTLRALTWGGLMQTTAFSDPTRLTDAQRASVISIDQANRIAAPGAKCP